MPAQIAIDRTRIAAFCQQNAIRRLRLFGSVLRDDFHSGSDVDMLVEFEPGTPVGMFRLIGLERELSEIVGRKVDLRLPGELSPYFRQRVFDEAEEIYVCG